MIQHPPNSKTGGRIEYCDWVGASSARHQHWTDAVMHFGHERRGGVTLRTERSLRRDKFVFGIPKYHASGTSQEFAPGCVAGVGFPPVGRSQDNKLRIERMRKFQI